jgi:hypothetical protein
MSTNTLQLLWRFSRNIICIQGEANERKKKYSKDGQNATGYKNIEESPVGEGNAW